MLVAERGRDPNTLAARAESPDRRDDVGMVARAPHRVVRLGVGRIERELERDADARERRESVEHGRGEQRAVRQRERRQDRADPGQHLGEVAEHEHLTAGDPDRGEAEVSCGGDRVQHPLLVELAPVGDARSRVGQAVRAGEVAVVRRIEPEPAPCLSGRKGLGEPFAKGGRREVGIF